MQKEDAISIEYLEEPARFADLINGFIYHGRELIRPEDIMEKNRTKTRITKEQGRIQSQTITADIVREVRFCMRVAVIALENQSEIHYAMPIRIMNIEAANYHRQWRKRAKQHRQDKDLRGAAFLSGFSKEDKLVPTITIVVYFGKEPWDGPRSIKEMMDLETYPPEFRDMVVDYPIHILEVRKYPRLEDFHTDLQYVFGFLQNAEDKEALHAYITAHNEVFEDLSEDAYDMISVMSHSEELQNIRKTYDGQGGHDMCQAIKEMIEDGRLDGRREGRQEGIQALVETCKELGITKETTLSKLQEKFALGDSAEEYLERYWA